MVKHASIGFTPYGFTMSSETNGLLLDVRFDFNLVHFVGIIISHVSDTILVKKKKTKLFSKRTNLLVRTGRNGTILRSSYLYSTV